VGRRGNTGEIFVSPRVACSNKFPQM
jgi:hypothetical protein